MDEPGRSACADSRLVGLPHHAELLSTCPVSYFGYCTRHVADSGKAQHRGTGGGVEALGPKQDTLPELLPLPLLPVWLPP